MRKSWWPVPQRLSYLYAESRNVANVKRQTSNKLDIQPNYMSYNIKSAKAVNKNIIYNDYVRMFTSLNYNCSFLMVWFLA